MSLIVDCSCRRKGVTPVWVRSIQFKSRATSLARRTQATGWKYPITHQPRCQSWHLVDVLIAIGHPQHTHVNQPCDLLLRSLSLDLCNSSGAKSGGLSGNSMSRSPSTRISPLTTILTASPAGTASEPPPTELDATAHDVAPDSSLLGTFLGDIFAAFRGLWSSSEAPCQPRFGDVSTPPAHSFGS